MRRIARMESFIEQASGLMALEAHGIDEIRQRFRATLGDLQGKLRERDKLVKQRAFDLKVRENLVAQVRDLEKQLRERERRMAPLYRTV